MNRSCTAALALLTLVLAMPSLADPTICASNNTSDQVVIALWQLEDGANPCGSQDKLVASTGNRTGAPLGAIEAQLNQLISACPVDGNFRQRNYCEQLAEATGAYLGASKSNDGSAATREKFRRRLLDAIRYQDPGLTTYRDNYAVLRPNPFEMKFQFSLKYKLFYDTSGLANSFLRDSLASRLYFTYTQESFWALGSPSAPFRDINFRPQLIWVTPGKALDRGITRQWWGVEHESNGRDGPESRGWNRVFGRIEYTVGDWRFLPEIWAIFAEADENADIADFYGNAGLGVRYESSNPDSWLFDQRLALDYRQGREKGGISASWSLPVKKLLKGHLPAHFNPDFHIRYWHGYGENLLTYNQKSSSLRFGLSFALD